MIISPTSILSSNFESSLTDGQTLKSVMMLKPPVLSCLPLQSSSNCGGQIGKGGEISSGSRVPQSGFPANGTGTSHSSVPLNNIGSVQNSHKSIELNTSGTTHSLTFASPIFPLKNRTNLPTRTPNFLLQTILRDSQQVKEEYEEYRCKTQAKLLKQEETIRHLKQSVETYKKTVLELRLQREVYVAREAHAFQEIQEGMHNLLQKISLFTQEESLKLKALSPVQLPSCLSQSPTSTNKESCSGLDLVLSLTKNLEDKLVTGKDQHVIATVEGTLKAHMSQVIEKFDQILLHIIQNKGCDDTDTTQVIISGDNDDSLYSASAEDNQDSDMCYHSTGSLEAPSNHLPLQSTSPGTEPESEMIYEIPTHPVGIALKSSSSSSSNETVMQRRKRRAESICSSKHLRKRSCRKIRRREVVFEHEKNHQHKEKSDIDDDGGGQDGEDDKPPVLSLPCRIAKHFLRRSESMPVLVAEADVSQKQKVEAEPKVPFQKEMRKDDALIGIKREHYSNVIHGKDFSKAGFVCLCGAKFTGAGGLYVHQVKTMENEKFSCRSCGKKFHYFSGLKAHRKSAHKQDFTQEVGCSRCGQVFKSKKDRQGHLDERGETCWLSGSYQSKDWEAIRNKRNLSSSSSYYSTSTSSSQNNAS